MIMVGSDFGDLANGLADQERYKRGPDDDSPLR